MADQATVKTNGPAGNRLGAMPASAGNGNHAGPGDMVSNVAEFGENLLSLAELQGRLALLEMKQNVQTARLTAPVILGGAVLGIASLPILLAGIAELLVSELGMKRGLALLGVAVAALAIAGTCIVIAGGRLRRSAVGFPLSGEEFTRNLNWVRTILMYSGRSARVRR
ncbi:MAG: phage holin family protein [Isosphaeraceae bacterium]